MENGAFEGVFPTNKKGNFPACHVISFTWHLTPPWPPLPTQEIAGVIKGLYFQPTMGHMGTLNNPLDLTIPIFPFPWPFATWFIDSLTPHLGVLKMPGQTGSGKTYTMEGCGFPNVTKHAQKGCGIINAFNINSCWKFGLFVLTRNQDDLMDHEKLSRIPERNQACFHLDWVFIWSFADQWFDSLIFSLLMILWSLSIYVSDDLWCKTSKVCLPN